MGDISHPHLQLASNSLGWDQYPTLTCSCLHAKIGVSELPAISFFLNIYLFAAPRGTWVPCFLIGDGVSAPAREACSSNQWVSREVPWPAPNIAKVQGRKCIIQGRRKYKLVLG